MAHFSFFLLFVSIFCLGNGSAQASAPATAGAVAVPAAPPKTTSTLVSGGLKQMEAVMFAEVLEFFAKKDFENLKRAANLLVKVFPDGPYADDSLYWMGRLASELGRDEEALFALDQLFRFYPRSNKTDVALVLKAVVYGKLGKWDQAEDAVFSALDSRKKGTTK